jgi:hypothetical protein
MDNKPADADGGIPFGENLRRERPENIAATAAPSVMIGRFRVQNLPGHHARRAGAPASDSSFIKSDVAETGVERSKGGFRRKSGHIRTSAHHHESEAAFPINRREARAAVSLFERVFLRPNPFPEPDRELSSLAAVVSSYFSLAPTLPANFVSFFSVVQLSG